MLTDILLAALKSAAGWAVTAVLGLFGVKAAPKVSNDERLGQEETKATQAEKELYDAQNAVDASRAAGASNASGGVREPHPGDKPWNPDALG